MKVLGPLFSGDARGSIAGCLTFQKGLYFLDVHRKIIKQPKRSYHQILLSSEYGEAISDWRILHPSWKDEYRQAVKGKPLMPQNLAFKDYLYYLRENYYDVAVYELSVYNADD